MSLGVLELRDSGTRLLDGPAGAIEVIFDAPKGSVQGLAVVAHPQPLLGGTALHKVPQLLARGLADAGWWVARPNFRGVGRSAGAHDEGVGETDDLLALCETLLAAQPALPVRIGPCPGAAGGAFTIVY